MQMFWVFLGGVIVGTFITLSVMALLDSLGNIELDDEVHFGVD